LADHKESDALLDVLHKYSEELLDSEDDQQSNCSELQTIDGIECQQMSHSEETSHLGSIKDLMIFDDHLYHKSMELRNDSIAFPNTFNNNINTNYILKPLSPLSCDSDSGYESVSSPTLSFEEQMIDSNDCLDQTFTELFPDLV